MLAIRKPLLASRRSASRRLSWRQTSPPRDHVSRTAASVAVAEVEEEAKAAAPLVVLAVAEALQVSEADAAELARTERQASTSMTTALSQACHDVVVMNNERTALRQRHSFKYAHAQRQCQFLSIAKSSATFVLLLPRPFAPARFSAISLFKSRTTTPQKFLHRISKLVWQLLDLTRLAHISSLDSSS